MEDTMERRIKIGTITVHEEFELNDRSGQIACDWWKHRIKPGTYDLTGIIHTEYQTDREPWSNLYWLIAGLDSTIIDEYVPNLYGGVPLDSGKDNDFKPRKSQYIIQMYGYQITKALRKSNDGTFSLFHGEATGQIDLDIIFYRHHIEVNGIYRMNNGEYIPAPSSQYYWSYGVVEPVQEACVA